MKLSKWKRYCQDKFEDVKMEEENLLVVHVIMYLTTISAENS